MILTGAICLALSTYHEARGVDLNNQIRVTNVAINRTKDGDYCKTIFAKNQFSWTKGVKFKKSFKNYQSMLAYYKVNDLNAYVKAATATTIALNYSFTDATFYHDTSIKHFKFNAGQVVSSNKYFIFYRG